LAPFAHSVAIAGVGIRAVLAACSVETDISVAAPMVERVGLEALGRLRAWKTPSKLMATATRAPMMIGMAKAA
jgi:hypothetical protein